MQSIYLKTFQEHLIQIEPNSDEFHELLKNFMRQMNDKDYNHWEIVDRPEISKSFIAEVLKQFDNPEMKMYYETYVRFVYQYFDDLCADDKIPQHIFEKQKKLSSEKLRAITCEYKLRVYQVVMAFCDDFGRGWTADDQQVVDYFVLALLLKRKQIAKFQVCFEEFLKKSSLALGEYYKVALKRDVRLLTIIATRRGFRTTRNFIFEKFPYIDLRSTVMKDIRDTQDFNIAIIDESKDESLSSMMKSLNGKLHDKYMELVNDPANNDADEPSTEQSNFEILLESLKGGFWKKCEFLIIFPTP